MFVTKKKYKALERECDILHSSMHRYSTYANKLEKTLRKTKEDLKNINVPKMTKAQIKKSINEIIESL